MGPLNWDAIKVAWDFVQAVSIVLFSVAMWWINRTRASEAAIRHVEARIDKVEKNVSALEHQVENLPSRKDIENLRAEQAKTNELLARMEATQRAQGKVTDRIHTYLWNGGGSRNS